MGRAEIGDTNKEIELKKKVEQQNKEDRLERQRLRTERKPLSDSNTKTVFFKSNWRRF